MPGQLTFFCELSTPRLLPLLADGQVPALLARHGCAVSMAMLDLTPERAEIVRALTNAGVPVTAWLVLDEDEGYWLTLDNVPLAQARWRQIRAWQQAHGLTFAAVGLDIEAPHDDAVGLAEDTLLTVARLGWLRRSRREWQRAVAQIHDLVAEVRATVPLVETYQFPFVVDERGAGSTLLQRVLGMADVRADREVLMLYRSALPAPLGQWLITAYGPGAEAIGVGITGGGVAALEASFADRELDLASTLHELARARQHTTQLYVFSLEGCVRQGWLEALLTAEWPTVPPEPHRPMARAARLVAQAALSADRLVARLRRTRP